MADVLTEPLTIYVAAVVALTLALIEIALPTTGIAGAVAGIAAVVAAWGLADSGLRSWPFAFVALALAIWAVVLIGRRSHQGWHAIALGLFALGSLLFALLADDVGTLVAAGVATVMTGTGVPMLQVQMAALFDRPSIIGNDAYSGRHVTVLEWHGSSGTIQMDGTRWNATTDNGPFEPGDTPVVDHIDGLKVHLTKET